MATFPLNFQFDLYQSQGGFQLQLFNNLLGGTPGTPKIRVELPNGGIIRSNVDGVQAFGDGDVTGLFIYSPLEFTISTINLNVLEDGQFQKPDEHNTEILPQDFSDGVYKVTIEVNTPSPVNTYASTRYFLITHQVKALLLEKLKTMYKSYPQIPYSVMYSGTEKRAIRSLMLLEAAEIEMSRGNIENARELVDTVIRYTKTWLLP
jgi:hypothetical protein